MIPFALLLFFCPVGDDLWALPKLFLTCAALAWWAWRTPSIQWRALDERPWGAVAVALVIATLFSVDLGNSLFAVRNPMGLGIFQWGVCYLLFLYGVEQSSWSFKTWNDLDDTIVLCGLVMAAYACAQGCGLEIPGFTPRLYGPGRFGSTQGHPVYLGYALVAVLPLMWDRLTRWGRPTGLLLVLGAALAARSRAALIAIPVVIAFMEIRKCASTTPTPSV